MDIEITSKEQAEQALAALEKYYGEPVRRISDYCKAFSTWFKVTGQEGVEMAIVKSNLLYRLIYLKLPLRTRKCPKHQGRWSGCTPDPCSEGCTVAGNNTGWLPDDEKDSSKGL